MNQFINEEQKIDFLQETFDYKKIVNEQKNTKFFDCDLSEHDAILLRAGLSKNIVYTKTIVMKYKKNTKTFVHTYECFDLSGEGCIYAVYVPIKVESFRLFYKTEKGFEILKLPLKYYENGYIVFDQPLYLETIGEKLKIEFVLDKEEKKNVRICSSVINKYIKMKLVLGN